MTMTYLDYLTASHHSGKPIGLSSICSAHPWVLRTALQGERPVLIESTCNQVNQFGGYSGMKPADFVRFVHSLAAENGFPTEKILLGGDHLGPSPWQNEPAEQAMAKAIEMVRAYVQAGYTKIHLDCSMPLGGERQLPVEVIAQRTVQLAEAAEQAAHESRLTNHTLRYVIGSEVPPPGGAIGPHEGLRVTPVEEARQTLEVMQAAFHQAGLEAAWERVRALVVQPGVEFGDDFVHDYDPAAAAGLARFIETVPNLVYEAHSTDYQTPESLAALVRDHFAILKVGPALTFALREAVFALAMIENELFPAEERSHLVERLEAAMLRQPGHWQRHYHGEERQQALARKYSFSDRIRYYWGDPDVQAAFRQLLANLERVAPLPLTLLSQYLPEMFGEIRRGLLLNHPAAFLERKIQAVLDTYRAACGEED